MLFNSLQYLLFLPVVVALYWFVPARLRNGLLLLASYFFYMSWLPKYGVLLAGLTTFNYLFSLLIAAQSNNQKLKKLLFFIGLTGNLACLAFFKYANFLVDSFFQTFDVITRPLGLGAGFGTIAPHWNIILPLGISFFVFEFIHYLTDIYFGNEPIRAPIRFALFAAFFPSQIAGPIKRYEDFDPQVVKERRFDSVLFQRGLCLILEGLFKKVALGDNLALIVQRGFASCQYLTPLDTWVAVIAFTMQIYYDFSGYTDIGRGSAMLFGIHLPENFNKPYLAGSVIDFWRRWHISLSLWLRDYLYKPLGGSRGGTVKQLRNLIVTMLLGGLWHGASWHFVLWGAYHGLGLAINHTWRNLTKDVNSYTRAAASIPGHLLSVCLTLLFVVLGWVMFRADSFGQASTIYWHMVNWTSPHMERGFLAADFLTSTLTAALTVYSMFQLIRALFNSSSESSLILAIKRQAVRLGTLLPQHTIWQTAGYMSAVILILAFAAKKSTPFIYFQF
jgi:alginate O-acetyltransferase complex protein AlgI